MEMNLLTWLIILGELLLLFTAHQITTQRDVPDVVKWYSWQSFLLTGTGALTAIVKIMGERTTFAESALPVLLITVLPVLLGLWIESVLARATVYQEGQKIKPSWKSPFASEEQKRLARAIWFTQRHGITESAYLWVFLGLIVLAFAIVFIGKVGNEPDTQIGVAVSLALHLIGLYNTFLRRDILTQIIGILTMDQGMYLAILKLVTIPAPAFLFVMALYFYTGITVLILFFILPQLRQEMNTLSLDEIARDSRLEG